MWAIAKGLKFFTPAEIEAAAIDYDINAAPLN